MPRLARFRAAAGPLRPRARRPQLKRDSLGATRLSHRLPFRSNVLAPTLATIPALYRKLEREEHRAFHHADLLHKADHFFNFCITAHSIRDYFLERAGKTATKDRQLFDDTWSQEPLLVAVADIANSAKHFVLRTRQGALRTPRTKRVLRRRSLVVDVYVSATGELKFLPRAVPDLNVTVSDGRKFELYSFMDAVTDYWGRFLRSKGISLRRQPLRRLRGA